MHWIFDHELYGLSMPSVQLSLPRVFQLRDLTFSQDASWSFAKALSPQSIGQWKLSQGRRGKKSWTWWWTTRRSANPMPNSWRLSRSHFSCNLALWGADRSQADRSHAYCLLLRVSFPIPMLILWASNPGVFQVTSCWYAVWLYGMETWLENRPTWLHFSLFRHCSV